MTTDRLLATYGRRHQIPALPGLTASVCPNCRQWYARPPRFRSCLHCIQGTANRARFRSLVTQAQTANTPQPSERPTPGRDLCLNLARVEALRRDHRNVRREDLRPEYQGYWL